MEKSQKHGNKVILVGDGAVGPSSSAIPCNTSAYA